MISKHINLLLCDDDFDDCYFFKEALEALSIPILFKEVHNGEQLMQRLTNQTLKLPDVLFLDLNMPRKNGFECLLEIKLNKTLKQLPVIVFSTALEQEGVNQLFKNGAQHFIRKPPEFSKLQKVIQRAITLIMRENILQPLRETFVIEIYDSLAV
jgi:CheY-like chemotaxis protein